MENVVIIDLPRNYAPRVMGARPVINETPTTITVEFGAGYTTKFDKRTGEAKGEARGRMRFMTADEYIVSNMMVTGRNK
jgi:hypothetical protein